MRDACVEQRGGSRELVVCGDERPPAVEDRDTRCSEALERPQARLDPVERREDVETAERDVAGTEAGNRLRGRNDRAEAGGCGGGAGGHDGGGGPFRGSFGGPPPKRR